MKSGWQSKTLGEVCRVDKRQGFYQELPYVGMEHIEAHTGRFLGLMAVRGGKSATYAFSPKHLLYGQLRPYLNKVMLPSFAGHCSTEIIPLLPREELSREFLQYWFLWDATVERIDATATGTRMPRANMRAVLNIELPLPSLPEQHRIVHLLDEAFAGIATARANAERNRGNARAVFESHLQSVFARRDAGWIDATMDQISTNRDSKRIPITKSVRKGGTYPYYGASGIVDYVEDYIFDGDALLVSEDGANLLMRSSPVAFSVSGKYWVNNHAHVLEFDDMATQRFVEFYLESISLAEFITGAAQPKLTQKSLNLIPIPIPKAVGHQAAIVDSLMSVSIETKRLAAIYQSKRACLESLKKALLHQAFTGQL